ncbi:MAG TPA: PadR family transcriptional regulator [Gemmatimonadales bacterium]|nr:PadR family transcriptional regulator [Gemmatimonadales bacterium]
MPPPAHGDALRGSLDLLILKALSLGPTHGWGIGQRIQAISRDALSANQGSLYPALQRLEHQGHVRSEWADSENHRRARFYRLTSSGRAALRTEVESWRRFVAAIELALSASGP